MKPRNVSGTVAQSYETELMRVVLEYEEEHHAQHPGDADWRVVFWLHDAAFLDFTRREDTHRPEIKRRVEAKAAEYGIPTYLNG